MRRDFPNKPKMPLATMKSPVEEQILSEQEVRIGRIMAIVGSHLDATQANVEEILALRLEIVDLKREIAEIKNSLEGLECAS